ncbi:MAG: FAD-binding protein, partial [Clostridia bacterium]|nr:FAD-binding protein [Clostridia bacterium]
MLRINELKLPLDYTEEDLKLKAAEVMKLQPSDIKTLKVFRRSVDSRKKQDVHFVFTVDVEVDADEKRILKRTDSRKVQESVFYHYVPVENRRHSSFRPVVVGFGPAGMFAALSLAEAGLNPIVLERGHDADTRTKDVRNFWEHRT